MYHIIMCIFADSQLQYYFINVIKTIVLVFCNDFYMTKDMILDFFDKFEINYIIIYF